MSRAHGSASRRFARPLGILLVALWATLVAAGCQEQGGASGGAEVTNNVAQAGNADDLLPVDCVLPGQIRQLGQQATYVTRGRAIKTTAADCRVRGGEYVAYDRANYATALKVWLPRAQEGDKEAQTLVGEIYEKGLGLAPDYTLAAAWYRKAADQGYAPAEINLGLLYERGQGVPKDPQQALDWYRRASGLQEGELQLASANAGEVEGLKTELSRKNEESEGLRTQNQQLEQQLADSRRDLAQRQQQASVERKDLGVDRDEVARQQAALQSERQKLQVESERVRRLEAERDRLAGERDRLVAAQAAAARAPQPPTAVPAPAPAAPVPSQADLERLRAVQQQAQSAQAAAEQARAQYAQQQAQLERGQAELARRDEQLKARQADVAALDDQIAQLKKESERRRDELAQVSRQVTTATAAGPTVQLIDPVLASTRGATEVRVRSGLAQRPVVGRVTAPAGLKTLLINDVPEQVGDGGMFQVQVPVAPAGTNVTIVAIDRQGKRADVSFRLKPDDTVEAARSTPPDAAKAPADQIAPGVDFGGYYALVIGNNQYQHLPKLETAVADAQAIGQLLTQRYGVKVTTLINANRYQILSALNKLREQLTEKDNLIIYYAGHGELDKVNQRGNWLPVDAEPDSTANWIPNVAITDILNAMSARHVLIVADSCYSGSLTRSALARLQSGLSSEARLAWIKSMVGERSRTALTSGGLKPVLDTGGGKHSIFAQAVLDALAKPTGIVEGQALFREISDRVARAARNVGAEQVPEYGPVQYAGHGGGEFFFVPTTAATGTPS